MKSTMFQQQLKTLILGLCIRSTVHPVVDQQPTQNRPEAKTFHIGSLELTFLHDTGFAVPNNGSIFGLNTTPDAVARVLGSAGVPSDFIKLDVDALLIRTPNKDIARSSIVSLAEPGWTTFWDGNKPLAIATRRRESSKLAVTHELIFAPHFPFPGVGRIQKSGNGYVFQPDVPRDK